MHSYAWLVRRTNAKGEKTIGVFSEFPLARLLNDGSHDEAIACMAGRAYADARQKLIAWALDPKRPRSRARGQNGEMMLEGIASDATGIVLAVGVGALYK